MRRTNGSTTSIFCLGARPVALRRAQGIMASMWTDTHCHLDAAEFDADRLDVVGRARAVGVTQVVLPAVARANFDTVRRLAHEHDFAYALGIHPLFVDAATDKDLRALRDALAAQRGDARLVAVGEIGLDHFVPGLDLARQARFYAAQLALAREFDLPVILHVRKSADTLLKHLRAAPVRGGIAHAFNGSEQQALAFVALGFRLGFGGAMTFPRALQIRRLASALPLSAIVLETDAPDIPPQWLYQTAQERANEAGAQTRSGRNEPGELPRIAETLAGLRGLPLDALAAATSANARAALPGLR
jgi:TatD DNase family protein